MTDSPDLEPLDAPELLAVPDRPDPDDIIASSWGQWVHDLQLARRPLVLKVTTDQGCNTPGQPLGLSVVADPNTAVVAGVANAWQAGRYRIDVTINVANATAVPTKAMIQYVPAAQWVAAAYNEIAAPGNFVVPGVYVTGSLGKGSAILNLASDLQIGRWGSDLTVNSANSLVIISYLDAMG